MGEDDEVAKWKASVDAGNRARRKKLLITLAPVAVVVLLFGGCMGLIKLQEPRLERSPASAASRAPTPLAAADRATAEQIIADARTREVTAARGTRSALLANQFLAGTGACPVRVDVKVPQEPGADATNNAKVAYTHERMSLGHSAIVLGDAADVPREDYGLDAALSEATKPMQDGLADGDTPQAFLGRVREAVKKSEAANDLVLVQSGRVDPVFDAQKHTFEMGRLRGRLYVVTRGTGVIVCAANVDVVGPRDFTAAGENDPDLAGNARAEVARLLTSDAIAAGIAALKNAVPGNPVAAASGAAPAAPKSKRRW